MSSLLQHEHYKSNCYPHLNIRQDWDSESLSLVVIQEITVGFLFFIKERANLVTARKSCGLPSKWSVLYRRSATASPQAECCHLRVVLPLLFSPIVLFHAEQNLGMPAVCEMNASLFLPKWLLNCLYLNSAVAHHSPERTWKTSPMAGSVVPTVLFLPLPWENSWRPYFPKWWSPVKRLERKWWEVARSP